MGLWQDFYVIPIRSGLYLYAMQDATAEERAFYQDYFKDRDKSNYRGILTSTDGQHYKFDGVIPIHGAVTYLSELIADTAETGSIVSISGQLTSEISSALIRHRKAKQPDGYCDIIVRPTTCDELLHIVYSPQAPD